MTRTPAEPHQRLSVLDRLVGCLWWLVFLGGVGAGAAIGIVLAFWLALPPLPGLLLIAACWLAGNAIGWTSAARAAATMTRRIGKHRKRKHVASPALPAPSHRRFPRPRGTGRMLAPGPACR